jgi:hypothetical protein
MSNETPGRDRVPGWGQPRPEPDAEEATAPWPTEATPPETPWPVEADPPAAPGPAAEPPAAAPGPAAEPPPAAPWGAPGPVAPWGAPVAPAPAPGGWGAPAQQQPPGGWSPPPQQAPGWGPTGPGAPGGPPVGWAPAPAKSGGNGCLKGCLIVGAIGVVLVIVAIVGLVFAAGKLTEGMVNPDGTLKSCTLISDQDLSEALDADAQALPLDGIWDATMGNVLDKRVLKDAEDCWIAVGSGVSTSATADAATGRLAASSGGDASGAFRQEKEKANRDGYFASDVSGLGDEAFCTALSEMGSAGVLVRSGDRLAYVSLVTADPSGGSDTCATAQQVAKRMLR